MSQPDDDKTQTFVPLTIGTMVSHYRIIGKIGAGGMGEIYLAEEKVQGVRSIYQRGVISKVSIWLALLLKTRTSILSAKIRSVQK